MNINAPLSGVITDEDIPSRQQTVDDQLNSYDLCLKFDIVEGDSDCFEFNLNR